MGISEAFYIPAALALIADYHLGPTRSRAVGLHQMGIYCGVIVGGFCGYVADSPALGWRWAFDACGVVGMVYAVPLVAPAARCPGECRRHARPRRPPRADASRELLANRSFILLVLYFTLPALAGWVVRDWMPAILKEQFNIGQGKAGVSATLYWQVAAIVGAHLGGWLADRWMRRHERGRIYVSALGMSLFVPAMFGVGKRRHARRWRSPSSSSSAWAGASSTATTCPSSARSCGPTLRATGLRRHEPREHQLRRVRRLGLRRAARPRRCRST